MMTSAPQPLSWFGIVRLGLVQTALGSVTVLTMATLNRVMVVELGLPSMLPGILVGLHYAMQVLRPRLGYGSDLGGRRTPWIVGGMLLHASGGVLAAIATAWMATQLVLGIALAVVAFVMIGIGVSSAATSLLVLLAKRTEPSRRSAAASVASRSLISACSNWVRALTCSVTSAIVGPPLLSNSVPCRCLCEPLLDQPRLAGLQFRFPCFCARMRDAPVE